MSGSGANRQTITLLWLALLSSPPCVGWIPSEAGMMEVGEKGGSECGEAVMQEASRPCHRPAPSISERQRTRLR
ncbi:exported hypothetical protein [Agrobacterium deltaense Zutra 3/1]|uniref:Uncharacterized protein n=1 Tax=Agrobacterium deltaense Zutra 3/1 TaxID=1183427 RepID=A0A1S7P7V0_9HYPH|nr:exported hypothetical protein [Agrobacterium deltaense Zutra 3/1]